MVCCFISFCERISCLFHAFHLRVDVFCTFLQPFAQGSHFRVEVFGVRPDARILYGRGFQNLGIFVHVVQQEVELVGIEVLPNLLVYLRYPAIVQKALEESGAGSVGHPFVPQRRVVTAEVLVVALVVERPVEVPNRAHHVLSVALLVHVDALRVVANVLRTLKIPNIYHTANGGCVKL